MSQRPFHGRAAGLHRLIKLGLKRQLWVRLNFHAIQLFERKGELQGRGVIHVLHCKLLKQSDLMLADTPVQQL